MTTWWYSHLSKRTGSPKELAAKLGISERWLYNFLEELKTELDCPIRYDQRRQSYVYDEPGEVKIGFVNEINDGQLRKMSGGENFRIFSHCMYRCSGVGYYTDAAKKFG